MKHLQTILVTERDVNRPGEDPVFHMAIWFLDKNRTYYWRVASVCDDGQLGAFSSVASFTMGSGAGNVPCTLAPPVLKSPADGEQTDTLIPPFVWNSVPSGHEYRWQLAATDQFTEVIDSSRSVGINPTVVPTLERRPIDNLDPGVQYYWRVNTICSEIDKDGEYSAPFSFRSGPPGGFLPPPPALLSPADGAYVGSVRVATPLRRCRPGQRLLRRDLRIA